MKTDKDKIIDMLARQPDGRTYAEIVRAMAFNVMIARGLKDSEAGRVISHQELKQRIKQW